MYCKFAPLVGLLGQGLSINSSKVYCKWGIQCAASGDTAVLIVAKCIVNAVSENLKEISILVLIVAKCIVNGELKREKRPFGKVLIVAKCIVNMTHLLGYIAASDVLIVAKCIVNLKKATASAKATESINSSRMGLRYNRDTEEKA